MEGTRGSGVRVFHATDRAVQILTYGFRDDFVGYSSDGDELIGVILTGSPAPPDSYGSGRQILEILLPGGALLDEYLLNESRRKEWCVPARVINAFTTVRLLNQDEIRIIMNEPT